MGILKAVLGIDDLNEIRFLFFNDAYEEISDVKLVDKFLTLCMLGNFACFFVV